MFIILIVNVLAVAASVYGVVYFMSTNAMIDDIRERAINVTELIAAEFEARDFDTIGEDSEAEILTSEKIQNIFEEYQSLLNLNRLYIAKTDQFGNIITTTSGEKSGYIPTGRFEADLRRSLDETTVIFGRGIYRADDGRGTYAVFWPFLNNDGAVCMEFDVDVIYQANNNAAIYSLVLSGALIFLFFIIAYLSMSKASEPFYKKLAYTDVLTGYENRMAFEHRMRECHSIADRGETVSIIVCDVNNLKTVNDVHGHEMGDKYLQVTADILFEHLPKGSPFYRIGGDEYATILIGLKEHELGNLMLTYREENRPTVKKQPFSCACGAATFTAGTDENLRDVFKRADEAMYVEKKRQKSLTGGVVR